jgi:hypothetical protein
VERVGIGSHGVNDGCSSVDVCDCLENVQELSITATVLQVDGWMDSGRRYPRPF